VNPLQFRWHHQPPTDHPRLVREAAGLVQLRIPAQKMLSIALRFTMNRRNGVGGVAGAFNGFTIAAGAGEYSAFMPWKACRNNWSCQKRHPASEQTANRAMFVCDFKLKPWRSAQYYAEMR
jgi:hypothetical protein